MPPRNGLGLRDQKCHLTNWRWRRFDFIKVII